MSKTFRQNDSRWGNFVYTRGGSTMAHAGCGPTSLADIICNNPKYKDITPLEVAKWLKSRGYNIQGTSWEGIRACLEAHGFKVASPDTMTRLFELLGAGVYKWGILNFKAGSRGGVTWTSGGHYVAFSAYKYAKSENWLYTRDPGARHNDGWHSHEGTMKGLCKKVWCCYLPEEKTVTKKYDGECIDISEHQGLIDWDTCPTDNVIIRASYTSIGSKFKRKTDKYFKRNIKGARGRKIGVYHFSQAKTEEEARAEARYLLKRIEPYKKDITLPVAIDWEFNDRLTSKFAAKNGMKANGKIIAAFCNVIKAAGYEPMVYANLSTLNGYLPHNLYKKWKIWVAQYNSTCQYAYKYYLWQYTSEGRVLGISGLVDLDKFYTKSSGSTTPTQKALKVGAKIRIKPGACQYGKSAKFNDAVYKTIYKVKEINGSRVVFTTLDGKTVIGAVSNNDCIVQ